MFKTFLSKVADGHALTQEEAAQAFDLIMSGSASPEQVGGFLMALRVRGETVAEITGGVRVMRQKALHVDAPKDALDTCGTGGDASGTLNISTAVAFVIAGCGVPIAKHGNKALSSKSGSADVLQTLGVNLDLSPERISQCITQAGVGFMMAPSHHSAMKHVAPARVKLGTRTIFNLMGPLSNPAGATRQLIGVYDVRWLQPMAEVLRNLGSEKVWIVHGSDGLDEITTTGSSHVAQLDQGAITTFEISPEDAGLPRATLKDLKGGTPEYNARRLGALLEGTQDAYRDIVVLNSAAALMVADKASTLRDGAALANRAIDEGRARSALDKLIELSNI